MLSKREREQEKGPSHLQHTKSKEKKALFKNRADTQARVAFKAEENKRTLRDYTSIHPYPLLTVSVIPVRTATLVKNGEISLITPTASYLFQDHT